MLSRNEKGKMVLNTLECNVFFGDLYQECKNDSEIDFIYENLMSYVECCADERREELKSGEED